MRETLTLSLPEKATKVLKQRVKERGFTSTSGYIQFLIEADADVISEKELLKDVANARRAYASGRTHKLTSLRDLP